MIWYCTSVTVSKLQHRFRFDHYLSENEHAIMGPYSIIMYTVRGIRFGKKNSSGIVFVISNNIWIIIHFLSNAICDMETILLWPPYGIYIIENFSHIPIHWVTIGRYVLVITANCCGIMWQDAVSGMCLSHLLLAWPHVSCMSYQGCVIVWGRLVGLTRGSILH